MNSGTGGLWSGSFLVGRRTTWLMPTPNSYFPQSTFACWESDAGLRVVSSMPSLSSLVRNPHKFCSVDFSPATGEVFLSGEGGIARAPLSGGAATQISANIGLAAFRGGGFVLDDMNRRILLINGMSVFSLDYSGVNHGALLTGSALAGLAVDEVNRVLYVGRQDSLTRYRITGPDQLTLLDTAAIPRPPRAGPLTGTTSHGPLDIGPIHLDPARSRVCWRGSTSGANSWAYVQCASFNPSPSVPLALSNMQVLADANVIADFDIEPQSGEVVFIVQIADPAQFTHPRNNGVFAATGIDGGTLRFTLEPTPPVSIGSACLRFVRP